MSTFKNNDFSDVLLQRRSVRLFDPEVKISREELQEMVEETITAPSACNLQSWHFEIVDTEAGKEKLKSYFMPFNYPQIESCSAMVLIFGDTQSHKNYRRVWEEAYEAGRISKEKLDEVFATFLPLYENGSREFLMADAMIDSSMAAMQFLLVTRGHGYEGNAIAGYNSQVAAKTLGLDPKRYIPVVAVAIGKPAENENQTAVYQQRYDVDQVLHFVDE
ncbi:nitroreductase family protein [Aerococcus urinae]